MKKYKEILSRGWLTSCVLVLLLVVCADVLAGIVVIGHPDSAVASLDKKQVKALFLKKTTSFPDGSTAMPGDQADGSEVRETFGKKVLKKKPGQLKAYWAKKVFSGKAMPPEELGDDAAVKAWVVKSTANVGYISDASADASVKVLLKIP